MPASEQQTLYNTRNAVGAVEDIRVILDGPDIYLSDKEQKELRAFAGGLMNGEAEGIKSAAAESLEDIFKRSLTKTQETFYPDYFENEAGASDKELIGGGQTLFDIVYANEHLTVKQRKEIAARSRDWCRNYIADGLAGSPANDAARPNLREATISYDPDALLAKFDDLQKYRQFYRQVSSRIDEEEQYAKRLNQAKKVVLNRYMRRVNELVAELYPSIFAMAQQLQVDTQDPMVAQWQERLSGVAPIVAQLYDSHVAARLDGALGDSGFGSFARRLDSFRNGADLHGGQYSPISEELLAYVERVTVKNEVHKPILEKKLVEELDSIEMDAHALAALVTGVIRDWGLLSKETATWEEVGGRSGPAGDGLFQVIVTPESKSLAVDSVKRVVKVPQSFRRSATQASPAGGLLVAAHELAHVQQALFDETLGEQIPLARIKGRQYVTVREAGGKYQERKLLEDYFGRSYAPNLHYLRALQKKLSGGNVAQVARSFYDSYVAQYPPATESQARAARGLAADRVLRLYRYGGHNSQPLDYIEQELIVEQLSSMDEQARSAFLLAAGSFNTHDLAMLRSVGIVEVPKSADCDPAADTMRVFMRDLYPRYHP